MSTAIGRGDILILSHILASNGVDCVTLPGVVTMPAGQRLAMISVVPLDDGPPDLNSPVILKELPSTNTPPAYSIGSPASAQP